MRWASKFEPSIGKMCRSINETFPILTKLLVWWVPRKNMLLLFLMFFSVLFNGLLCGKEKKTLADYADTARLFLADERAQFVQSSKKIKKEYFFGAIPLGAGALHEQKKVIFNLIEKAFLEKLTEKKALNAWVAYYKHLFSLNALILAQQQPDAGSTMKVLRAISAFCGVFEKDPDGVRRFSWHQKVQFLKELISCVVVIESVSRSEWTTGRLEPYFVAIIDATPPCAQEHDPAWCPRCGTLKTLEIVLIGLCEQKKWEDPEVAKEAQTALIKVGGLLLTAFILWKMRSFLLSKVFN